MRTLIILLIILVSGCATVPPAMPPVCTSTSLEVCTLEARIWELEQQQRRSEGKRRGRQMCQSVHGANSELCNIY